MYKTIVKTAFAMSLLSLIAIYSAMADEAQDDASLRSYAEKAEIWVGAPIQGKFFNQDPLYQSTLGREFDLATSIVLMKLTQPEQGQFNFSGMERDMRFAKAQNMKLFGQALVYRNDNSPGWLRFNSPGCGGWSPEQLDRILKEHIDTVVRHGGDMYYGWEVVNESLSPGANGCWSRVLGDEQLLAKAFRYAHSANPNAVLLLNETFGRDGVDTEKVDRFFNRIKRLKSQGVPIGAAGVEMHLEAPQLRANYIEEFKHFLDGARDAGVQAYITEMDVYQGSPGSFPHPFEKQREIFYNVVRACLQDSNCRGFSVWGLGDRNAWHPPSRNLADTAPLLLDENYGKKPAYYGVLVALKEGRR